MIMTKDNHVLEVVDSAFRDVWEPRGWTEVKTDGAKPVATTPVFGIEDASDSGVPKAHQAFAESGAAPLDAKTAKAVADPTPEPLPAKK